MLAFISAHIPWNAISNLKLQWLYSISRRELMPLSASTLSNIWRREYSWTVDSITKQLPSRHKVSLALDGWTSTNKLAITSLLLAIGVGNAQAALGRTAKILRFGSKPVQILNLLDLGGPHPDPATSTSRICRV
jgi:hypothetical protein